MFPVLTEGGRLDVFGGTCMCRVSRTDTGTFVGTQMCPNQLGECMYRGEGLMMQASECTHTYVHTHISHDLGAHGFLETRG